MHKKRDEGILLSLRDIATLTDSGLEEFIVGRYTFKKKKGKVLPEIDKMPRLKKNNGNCIFYEEESGLCTQYGLRPTICRRFPYENRAQTHEVTSGCDSTIYSRSSMSKDFHPNVRRTSATDGRRCHRG